MGTHEPQQPPSATSVALLTHWAVDLLVPQTIVQALTAPCQYVSHGSAVAYIIDGPADRENLP